MPRRRGAKGAGTFSGDHQPPLPWRYFYVRLVGESAPVASSRTRRQNRAEIAISELTGEELAWLSRTVVAELTRRKDERRKEA